MTLLNLSLNQLAVIPRWVGTLKSLRVLNLAYNQIRTLESIVKPARPPLRLEVLDVSNNHLETIDDVQFSLLK